MAAFRLSRGGHRLGEPADSLASRVDYDEADFVSRRWRSLAKYASRKYSTRIRQSVHREAFTGVLLGMNSDQHGRQRLLRDNVFVERLCAA